MNFSIIHKLYDYNVIFLLVLMSLFGCGDNISDSNSNPNSNFDFNDNIDIPGAVKNSLVIYPDEGGIVHLPSIAGNGWLEIPPGALNEPTNISIYALNESTPGRLHLGFEPSGLKFNTPVKLTIHYPLEDDESIPLIQFYHISEQNDLIDMGSEQLRWALYNNVKLDEETQMISGEMNHFSTSLIFFGTQRVAYLIFNIPGKYLRPGDAVFVLTGGSSLEYNWYPGHIGMIRSINTTTGETTVIESTSGGGASGVVDGVQLDNLVSFKSGTHVFMGARRPVGEVFTEAERIAAVNFSEVRIGEDYSIWGSPLSGGPTVGWSCSGLVEASWDDVKRGSMGTWDFFPSPVEMWEATIPINEIEVVVGEEVIIPVYPVVVNPNSTIVTVSQSGYYDVAQDVSTPVTVSGLPDGAKWQVRPGSPIARSVVWTPKPKNIGNSYDLDFNLWGSVTLKSGHVKKFNITKRLTLKVRGVKTYVKIEPSGRGEIGRWYLADFPIPTGATIIEGVNGEHLIDTATGVYPEKDVFPKQVFDNFEERWVNDEKTRYGAKIHIKRLDGRYDPVPTGSHLWMYWLDYIEPFYSGPE